MNNGPDAQYRERLEAGRFELQQCDDCRHFIFYPRMLCPFCGGSTLHWVAACGHGTIYSFTIIRRHPDKGGDYAIVLVDLDEGVRMMSSIAGAAPDSLQIGLSVKATIAHIDGQSAVVFAPSHVN